MSQEQLMLPAGYDDGTNRWNMDKAATIAGVMHVQPDFNDALDGFNSRISDYLAPDNSINDANKLMAAAGSRLELVEIGLASWDANAKQRQEEVTTLESELTNLLDELKSKDERYRDVQPENLYKFFNVDSSYVPDEMLPLYFKYLEVLGAYDRRDTAMNELQNTRDASRRDPESALDLAASSKQTLVRRKNDAERVMNLELKRARNIEKRYLNTAEKLYDANPRAFAEMPTEDFGELLERTVWLEQAINKLTDYEDTYRSLSDELRSRKMSGLFVGKVFQLSHEVADATSDLHFKPRSGDEKLLPQRKEGGIDFVGVVINTANALTLENEHTHEHNTYIESQKCADLLTYVNRMLTAYRQKVEDLVGQVNSVSGAAIFELSDERL